MKKRWMAIGAACSFVAMCLLGTTFKGQMIVQDGDGAPTCATASGDGDLCVEDALEANGALDVAGASTLTGAVTLGAGITAGGTITLENGGTILNDTNNEIQLGEGSEDLSLGFGTSNEVTVTTDTGVTRVDFESIGVKTATPLLIVESQHYCGQGANGTTTTYIGPVLEYADKSTYVFGAAGCDTLDNTNEGTANNPGLARGDWKVVGMACTIDDGGTDDIYTFQLRDDTANVAGVTCAITLDGSGVDTCTVILDAPVTVADNSQMAVSQAAATDDDCSACDTECWVYFTR